MIRATQFPALPALDSVRESPFADADDDTSRGGNLESKDMLLQIHVACIRIHVACRRNSYSNTCYDVEVHVTMLKYI